MQKKLLNGLLLALFGILFYTACTSDVIETPAPPPPSTDTISFSQEIQPVFNERCTSCHRPGGTSPDLTAANSYNSLNNGLIDKVNPEQSIVYLQLLPSGPSHPVKDPDFATVILNWIRQGALNN